MSRSLSTALLAFLALPPAAHAQRAAPVEPFGLCRDWRPDTFRRNPTPAEFRCRYGTMGPGRFGLLSYVDLPVYQPATPMPGTHLVGLPGLPAPGPGESYEAWEWRVLRTYHGREATRVERGLEGLDPLVAGRVLALEARLAVEGIRVTRRETWRSPERQAYLFQQGRSRPGSLATATLTSWHSVVDSRGNPAARAVDYWVPPHRLERFHELARAVGLHGFGPDSHDPGHLFLPLEEPLPPTEVALLRVLPRVPEVTLATGRPVDRPLPPEGREALRELAQHFAFTPFRPDPVPELAGVPSPRRRARWTTLSASLSPGPVGDGARGAPCRSGGR